MNYYVIIPASGLGRRMNSFLPKQFIKINGKEILLHTLQKFTACPGIKKIYVAVSSDYLTFTEKLLKKNKLEKNVQLIIGGKERQHSVFNAFKEIPGKKGDLICVHDAARPFISQVEIQKMLKVAEKKKSLIFVQRASDTVKTGKNFVEKTLDRRKILLVKTPQIFEYSLLKKAFEYAWQNNLILTDESGMIEKIGKRVYFYESDSENRKITTKTDLIFASLVL